MSAAYEVAEPLDAVVVGGGIAGLTAAWTLRRRRILLLEADDRVGGRLRSERRGEYWLNYGAHLFPGPGTVVDEMVRELGLEVVPVTGSTMGLAMGDRLVNGGRVETYPFRIPLRLTDRVAFARAGLKVRRAVARHQRIARPAAGESPADVRSRVLGYLDDITFADLLGELPEAVESVFSCAAHRATAELDELSAGCGIGLFALVWAGKRSLIARNLVGGSGELPAALARTLGARVKVDAPVVSIRAAGPHQIVEYRRGNSTDRVTARQVVVAVPASQAALLIREVAPAAATALAQMSYGPFLSVAVETGERGRMPWDDVYAMATPGRAFDMFTNQAQALRGTGVRRPGGSLLLFAGGHGAAALMKEPDEVIRARFIADLEELFPESRAIVVDARVRRWTIGNVFARPGRQRLQRALEGPLGPHGNVHLAGDYFAELGNIEAAAQTGRAAAERIERAFH